MQSASEQVIPAGMVAYGPDHPDYPRRPLDWDPQGRNLRRSGAEALGIGSMWTHARWPGRAAHDIIAYTPKPLPPPAPLVELGGEVIQADREAYADYAIATATRVGQTTDEAWLVRLRAGEMDDCHGVQIAKIARHRLNTRPAPAETEGVEFDDSRVMQDFYLSMYYDPNPVRPADNVQAAIEYVRDQYLSTPPADAGMLREAIRYLMPYLDWMLGPESPGYHPTMPSAVAAVKAALSNGPAALNSQAHQIREGNHG